MFPWIVTTVVLVALAFLYRKVRKLESVVDQLTREELTVDTQGIKNIASDVSESAIDRHITDYHKGD